MCNRIGMQRKALGVAILSALGLSAIELDALAVSVEPGAYDLVILPTPVVTNTTGSGATSTGYKFGKDGAWSSAFTFGGPAPSSISQAMTDTAIGGGVAGDSWAGILGITIDSSGELKVSSFSKDTILGTAGGNFTQHLGTEGTSLMTGSVNLASGAFSITPTGRLGDITLGPQLNKRWNIPQTDACDGVPPPAGTPWGIFTTGSISNAVNTINGSVFVSIPDDNGDGILDYSGVLVSGGIISDDWGDFCDARYFETWSTKLLSNGPFVRNDEFAGPGGQATTHNVLANDLPTTGLMVTGRTDGANGTTAIGPGGGSVIYTAAAGAAGIDTYTYTATGPNAVAKTATVTVINSDPGAVADNSTTQQGVAKIINVSSNDFATLGSDLTSYTPSATSTKGATVTSNGNGTVTYTPLLDIAGTDTFTYTFKDNDAPQKTSNTATVTVTVTPGPLVSQGIYGPGTVATAAGKPSGVIVAADVGVTDPDLTAACVGGCFDFIITGAAATTKIVLPPLGVPINTGSNLRYRKFTNGAWEDFDTTGGDSIASAPKSVRGGCPTPGNAAWKTWTANSGISPDASHQDDECLELTINDAIGTTSTNDSNSAAGTIADPGGLGSNIAAVQPSGTINSFQKNTSGGCTISVDKPGLPSRADWLVLGLMGAWLGALRLRRSKSAQ